MPAHGTSHTGTHIASTQPVSPSLDLSTRAATPVVETSAASPSITAAGRLPALSAASTKGALFLHGDFVTANILSDFPGINSLDVVHDA